MNTGAKVTLAHANPDAGGVMASDALLAAAREAATVAQRFADAVDQEARFPHEAFEVLRDQGLLGAMVPAVLGGSGASLATVAAICKVLGETCASTGMIYAMHQIQVACLLDHGTGSP